MPQSIQKSERQEHIDWCKKRALEYVEQGDLLQAFTSMTSDLNSNPITENHIGIMLGMQQISVGLLNTPAEMKKFIEDFN